jgi:hypothetical protein
MCFTFVLRQRASKKLRLLTRALLFAWWMSAASAASVGNGFTVKNKKRNQANIVVFDLFVFIEKKMIK